MRATPLPDKAIEDHDRGLAFDLPALVQRRQALMLLGGTGLGLGLGVLGCSSAGTGAEPTSAATGSASSPATSSPATSRSTTAAAGDGAAPAEPGGSCEAIPEETAGPFPGDGSNGPDVLRQAGVVRRDIRASFGDASGVATGVPVDLALTVVDLASGCAAVEGAAVYVWHCDATGNYSLYSEATAGENYLRGVQEADGEGKVRFTTIFPGCYPGRWPHVHLQVYPTLAAASTGASELITSQLAFPEVTCSAVYAGDGYPGSAGALSQISLAADNVFGEDGAAMQLASISGDAGSGLLAQLTVGVML